MTRTSSLIVVIALLSCSNCAHYLLQRSICSHIGHRLIVYWRVISAQAPCGLSSFLTWARLGLVLTLAWLEMCSARRRDSNFLELNFRRRIAVLVSMKKNFVRKRVQIRDSKRTSAAKISSSLCRSTDFIAGSAPICSPKLMLPTDSTSNNSHEPVIWKERAIFCLHKLRKLL